MMANGTGMPNSPMPLFRETLTGEQIDSLTKSLSLDYILTGSALEYEEFDNSFLGKVPQVSFNCKLIDCDSKKTVWVANSNGRGDKGEIAFGIGTVKSADNLARKMVEETVSELNGLFAKKIKRGLVWLLKSFLSVSRVLFLSTNR